LSSHCDYPATNPASTGSTAASPHCSSLTINNNNVIWINKPLFNNVIWINEPV
jgi:hypothetical protein